MSATQTHPELPAASGVLVNSPLEIEAIVGLRDGDDYQLPSSLSRRTLYFLLPNLKGGDVEGRG